MFPQTILLGLVAAVPTPDDYQAYTPAAVDEKPVFAHYMLCFAAFGEKGKQSDGSCVCSVSMYVFCVFVLCVCVFCVYGSCVCYHTPKYRAHLLHTLSN